MPGQYWHPDYWGIGGMFTQKGNVDFAMSVNSPQKMLDPRELLKTQQFKVEKSYYTDGILTTIIQFL